MVWLACKVARVMESCGDLHGSTGPTREIGVFPEGDVIRGDPMYKILCLMSLLAVNTSIVRVNSVTTPSIAVSLN